MDDNINYTEQIEWARNEVTKFEKLAWDMGHCAMAEPDPRLRMIFLRFGALNAAMADANEDLRKLFITLAAERN
jgi:hypothetical protein